MSKILCPENFKGKCKQNNERLSLNFWVMLLTGGSPVGIREFQSDSDVVFMDFSSLPSFFCLISP